MNDLVHPLWIEPWPLILASASATRANMLRAAGIPIEIIPADVDERLIEAPLLGEGAAPADIAATLARAKAEEVSRRHPRRMVLGADQVLAIGSECLTKPSGTAAARRQLLRLRDNQHILHSVAALAIDGHSVETIASSARLVMRSFSEDFLDRYLAVVGEQVTTSVGGYQIEGAGMHLFSEIQGDHFTVLGLPLLPLLDSLRRRGMVAA